MPNRLIQVMVVLAMAMSTSARAEGWKLGDKELYPWDVVKRPGLSSAWKSAVTKARVPKQEQSWVLDMSGPSTPLVAASAGGRKLVVGHTCRPHDCYDNNLVFAIDPANKQIWGLRQGRGQSPKAKQFIGSPDPEMRNFLLQTLDKEFPVNP